MALHVFEVFTEPSGPAVAFEKTCEATELLGELRGAVGLTLLKIVDAEEGVVIEGGVPEFNPVVVGKIAGGGSLGGKGLGGRGAKPGERWQSMHSSLRKSSLSARTSGLVKAIAWCELSHSA